MILKNTATLKSDSGSNKASILVSFDSLSMASC